MRAGGRGRGSIGLSCDAPGYGLRADRHWSRMKLYDVRNHGGTRYFSRLRVSGAKTENGVWNWCFNFGEWQASCQG
jgi:hypothetical protein